MAKANNFFDTDMFKMPEMFKMPDFSQVQADFTRMFGDMAKMVVNGKAPTMDFETVAATQRKNLEAFTAANQLAFEGFKACCQRQADIARQTVEEFGRVTKELNSVATPEEKLVRQAEFAKSSFENAINNTREMVDMVQKAQDEATNVISRRVAQNFDEMKAAFQAKKDIAAVNANVKKSA